MFITWDFIFEKIRSNTPFLKEIFNHLEIGETDEREEETKTQESKSSGVIKFYQSSVTANMYVMYRTYTYTVIGRFVRYIFDIRGFD